MSKPEEIRKLLTRIKRSDDGPGLIAYFEELSQDNYQAWKRDDAQNDGIHKGYALALDNLIELFNDCDQADKPSGTQGNFHY